MSSETPRSPTAHPAAAGRARSERPGIEPEPHGAHSGSGTGSGTGSGIGVGMGAGMGAGMEVDELGRRRAAQLADALNADGVFVDPQWREAFTEIPRHRFVPQWFEPDRKGGFVGKRLVAEWLDGVYADRSLPVNIAETDYAGTTVGVVAAGATQPSVLAEILHRADLRTGQRVLQIGTGTGWGTGLIAYRVGAGQVTSIEIDPGLAGAAGSRLAGLGLDVDVRIGSGFAPPPVRGGYDRIVCFCAVPRIPRAWQALLAPGGRVVTPLSFGATLVVLAAEPDGTLRGRVTPDPAAFLPMRASIEVPVCAPAPPPPLESARVAGVTRTDIGLLDNPDVAFWLALHNPDLIMTGRRRGERTRESVQIHTPSAVATVGSGHVLDDGPGHGWLVRQDDHQLWDLVETVIEVWTGVGRPGRDQAELVARPDGLQYIALADDTRNHQPTTSTSAGASAASGGSGEPRVMVDLPGGEVRSTPTPWPRKSVHLDGARPGAR